MDDNHPEKDHILSKIDKGVIERTWKMTRSSALFDTISHCMLDMQEILVLKQNTVTGFA